MRRDNGEQVTPEEYAKGSGISIEVAELAFAVGTVRNIAVSCVRFRAEDGFSPEERGWAFSFAPYLSRVLFHTEKELKAYLRGVLDGIPETYIYPN